MLQYRVYNFQLIVHCAGIFPAYVHSIRHLLVHTAELVSSFRFCHVQSVASLSRYMNVTELFLSIPSLGFDSSFLFVFLPLSIALNSVVPRFEMSIPSISHVSASPG